jgi:DNA-binding NtrC family response regulator
METTPTPLSENGHAEEEEVMISVLYIDDSQLLLDVTCLFLERDKDLTVDISLSIEEAIRKLDYITYDVIVTDYMPEGRNVVPLLEYLEDKGRNVPLICLSAFPPGKKDLFTTRNYSVTFIHKLGNSHSHFDDLLRSIRAVVRERTDQILPGLDNIPNNA